MVMTNEVRLMCVECEDTEANVQCETCQDVYCTLCYEAQHRSGSRLKHKHAEMVVSSGSPPPAPIAPPGSDQPTRRTEASTTDAIETHSNGIVGNTSGPGAAPSGSMDLNNSASTLPSSATERNDDNDDLDVDVEMVSEIEVVNETSRHSSLLRESRYIPLRLSDEERGLFNLLDASLNVSEYTDKVDILSYRSTSKRIIHELNEMFSTISGLMVANDFRLGKKLVRNNKFDANGEFFSRVFEVGRRYKIMNPERMRNNYGKMIYLLQDANLQEIKSHVGFSCVGPIQNVANFLKERDALDLLEDVNCEIASAVMTANPSNADTAEIFSKKKQSALEELVKDHVSSKLTKQDIELVVSSISDANSYLALNRYPILRMIDLLHDCFHPGQVESPQFSLEIRAGRNGARLNHSHSVQFEYVLQSLLFWKNITSNMLRLWWAVEDDLLSGHMYRLRDTGQGLNRVQYAPNTSHLVHALLHGTQKMCQHSWVGSSTVHLGDHNVPNALMFIDKYTQISRILSPIVHTIDELDSLAEQPSTKEYIVANFQSAQQLKKVILCDFFKHGFDGSGADNFFDAGSCIDGRLTSAWNWCSKIEKKSFFHVFLMAGFVGFDGHFEK